VTDSTARLILAGLVAAITLGSGAVLTYPMFRPEIRRRERVVVVWMNRRGGELGLRGRFTFAFSDWSPGTSIGAVRTSPLARKISTCSRESVVNSKGRASRERIRWSGPTGGWAFSGSPC